MSADNILVVVSEKGGKYGLYDVGFSYLTGGKFDLDSRTGKSETAHAIKQHEPRVGVYGTRNELSLAIARYRQTHIVEYGVISLIPNTRMMYVLTDHPTGEEK